MRSTRDNTCIKKFKLLKKSFKNHFTSFFFHALFSFMNTMANISGYFRIFPDISRYKLASLDVELSRSSLSCCSRTSSQATSHGGRASYQRNPRPPGRITWSPLCWATLVDVATTAFRSDVSLAGSWLSMRISSRFASRDRARNRCCCCSECCRCSYRI